MFYSIKELVQQAELDFQGNVAELMITTEFELTGREREEVLLLMERNLEVMKASVELGLSEKKSRSGLTGGDAAKLDHYIKKGKTLSDFTVLSAARNAIAVNEHKTISVTGISIGGGNIQVTELNGFAVSLNMNTPTIIIVHQDVPGMIAHVTEALSRFDINIAQMNVTREKAGEKAIMIIEVDSRNCDESIEEIRKIPHLHNVNFFQ